jgi:hypothetical protein
MRLLLIILICFIGKIVHSQELSSIRFGSNSPLQTNTIYDLYFSPNNKLLYVATNRGLWSYNGIEFINYLPNSKEVLEVTNIQEHPDGHIYCQDFNSHVYYVDNKDLVVEVLPEEVKRFSNYIITPIYTYYKTDLNITAVSNKTKECITIPAKEANGHSLSSNLYYLKSENSKEYYLYQIIDGTKSIKIKKTLNNTFIRNYKDGWCDLTEDNTIVSQTGKLLVDFNLFPQKITPYRIIDVHEQLFVACKEGFYDVQKNKLFLKGKFITQAILDSENNLWMATLNHGLHKVSSLSNKVYPFKSVEYRSDFILKDKNQIIYSNDIGNLYVLSDTSSSFEGRLFYRSKNKNQIKNLFVNREEQLVSSGSHCILFNKNLKKTYQSPPSYGAIFPDHSNNKIYQKRREYGLIMNISYSQLKPSYLVGYFDPTANFDVKKIDEHGILIQMIKDSILAMAIDLDSLPQGIVLWDKNAYTSINNTLYKVDFNRFEIKKIADIPNVQKLFLEKKRFFVLTDSLILELNKEGEIIREIVRLNELKQFITNISLSKNHLSLCTNNAVYLYDATTFKYIHEFTSDNGIISTDFNRARIFDEELLVNGSKGISRIPLNGNYNKGKPSLKLSTVWINKEETAETNFNYAQNDISVLFNLRSFTVEGTLYWRLNKKEWKTIKGKPQIDLEELQYGNYTIEAYFENNLGSRTKMVLFSFYIDQPFWFKWWFFSLIALILFGLGFVLYRVRLSQIQTKNELQKNLIASQMTALKSQMNPHFIFNALNSIQSLIRYNKNKEAYKYVNKFATLLRQTLNYSDKDFIPLEKEIELLTSYLDMEKMRLDDKLDYQISIPDDFNVQIPSMIIQPFVENGIKHGLLHKESGDKELSIDFELKDNLLYCTIIDNGIGRAAAGKIQQSQQVSFSTGATQKRLYLLQEFQHTELGIEYTDLMDELGKPTGTKVQIKIPIEL